MKKQGMFAAFFLGLWGFLPSVSGQESVATQDFQVINENFGIDGTWFAAPICAVIALIIGFHVCKVITAKTSAKTRFVAPCTMSFYKKLNKVAGIFFLAIFAGLFVMALFKLQSAFVPFAFLLGGIVAALCWVCGLDVVTTLCENSILEGDSDETKDACRTALKASFAQGVMALAIPFGAFLLLYYLLDSVIFSAENMEEGIQFYKWSIIPQNFILGQNGNCKIYDYCFIAIAYGMGVSLWGLLARMSSAVFSKSVSLATEAAENSSSSHERENDPKNPAYAAINMAHNFGSAGKTISFASHLTFSLIGAFVIACALPFMEVGMLPAKVHAVMYLTGAGLIASLLVFCIVYFGKSPESSVLKSIHVSAIFSAILVVLMVYFIGTLRIGGKNVASFFNPAAVLSIAVGCFFAILLIFVADCSLYHRRKKVRLLQKTSFRDYISFRSAPIVFAIAVLTFVTVFLINRGFGPVVHADLIDSVSESADKLQQINDASLPESTGSWCFGIYGLSLALLGMLMTIGTVFSFCNLPVRKNTDFSYVQDGSDGKKSTLVNISAAVNVAGKFLSIVFSLLSGIVFLGVQMYSLEFGCRKLGLFSADVLARVNDLGTDNLRLLCDVYDIRFTNVYLYGGLLLGVGTVVIFYILNLLAIRKSVVCTMNEIGRQAVKASHASIEKITDDYLLCADAPMESSIKSSVVPIIIAVAVPLFAGLLFPAPALFGILIGGLLASFVITSVFNRGIEATLVLQIRVMFFTAVVFTPLFLKCGLVFIKY